MYDFISNIIINAQDKYSFRIMLLLFKLKYGILNNRFYNYLCWDKVWNVYLVLLFGPLADP